MNTFKVIEIVNGNTIKVSPEWSFPNPANDNEIVDDKIKISGLKATEDDDVAKKRLNSFLLGKEVELFDPKLIEGTFPGQTRIRCKVLIEKTDVNYYFPEYKELQFSY